MDKTEMMTMTAFSKQGRMSMNMAHYLSHGYGRPVSTNPSRSDTAGKYREDDNGSNTKMRIPLTTNMMMMMMMMITMTMILATP
jgi:hypothetical protein